MLSTIKELKLEQWVQWKYVFILTVCLMGLHTLLFPDNPATQGNAPTAPTTKTKAPKVQPPPPEPVKTSNRPPPHAPPSAFDAGKDEVKHHGNPETFVAGKPSPEDEFAAVSVYDAVPEDEHTAICLSVKDQAADMVEWLVHHYHHMGIRRFYIMDDGSDPPLSTFEYPGIPRSALTFTYQPVETRTNYMQTVFYSWCIERYHTRHTWIAFIDTDEYIDTPGKETLREFLESFEANDTIGAIGVNWQMHTSNGHLVRPESIRKSYTTCIYDDPENGGETTDNNHVKTIAKAKFVGPAINPHRFVTAPSTITVGENWDEIVTAAWRKPITRDRISLHHYAVKSRGEYEEKILRGNGMTDPKGEEFWNHVENDMEHVDCPVMAHYEP